MKWNEMSEIQRNALIAEKVMGWQWIAFNFYDVSMDNQLWLLPRERATAHLAPGEWTYYIEEPEVYPEGSVFPLPHKDNHYLPTWIPHYTTSMDAAWMVLRHVIKSKIDGKYTHSSTELMQWFITDADLWSKDTEKAAADICLASLRAVGEIIED